MGWRVRLDFAIRLTFIGDEKYAEARPMFDLWGRSDGTRIQVVDRDAPFRQNMKSMRRDSLNLEERR